MERDEIAKIQDFDEIFRGILKDERSRTGIESPLSDKEVAGAVVRAAWRQLMIVISLRVEQGFAAIVQLR